MKKNASEREARRGVLLHPVIFFAADAYYSLVMFMRETTKQKWLPYLVSILVTFAVAGLAGIATMQGLPAYAQLAKPPLTPPQWVFPVAWGILYLLMAVGAAMVWRSGTGEERKKALVLYGVQLVVNALWSVLFFDLQRYLLSFFWLVFLWLLILAMYKAFSRINKTAGRLQIPYLLWVLFAGYLNLGIWLLN